ncbi:OmpW family protein [Novosphingobium colocasiae]
MGHIPPRSRSRGGDTHGAAPAVRKKKIITMRKLTMIAALAATTAIASPALAGSSDGKIQVKVLATGVLPDGGISSVKAIHLNPTSGGGEVAAAALVPGFGDVVASLANPDTKANNNVVPTLAIEYFFNKTFSAETICCFTEHHVNGTKGAAGTNLVNHVLILPATLTLKAHLDTGTPIKPYVGAGPALFLVFGEKPGDTAKALDIKKVKMSNEVGFALQGGVDIAVNDKGMGISLDAKRYFIKPTASFYDSDGTLQLKTKHDLNPWVLSAGVTYRF